MGEDLYGQMCHPVFGRAGSAIDPKIPRDSKETNRDILRLWIDILIRVDI